MHSPGFRPPFLRARATLAALVLAVLAGCAADGQRGEPGPYGRELPRAQIADLLPASLADRSGWAADVHAAFVSLGIAPTLSNVCAALAIAEQESSYRADPAVPGLARIAREEIDRRAARVGVPDFAVRAALQLASPDGRAINIDGGFSHAYLERGHSLIQTPASLYAIILPTPDEIREAREKRETPPMIFDVIDSFDPPLKIKNTHRGKELMRLRDELNELLNDYLPEEAVD